MRLDPPMCRDLCKTNRIARCSLTLAAALGLYSSLGRCANRKIEDGIEY
jgi:hypothetical protein